MRMLLIATLAASLAVTACNKPEEQVAATPSPTETTPAGPPEVAGTIDWQAARDAKLKQPSQGDSNVNVAAATDGKPVAVPMLLPSGVVQVQSAGPPAVRVTDDGYFATYKTAKYDAIVNGSKQAYETGAKAVAGEKEKMKFSTSEGSAQIAFSRYGADYLIEFECKAIDSGESCITEQEAKDFADSLFVATTQ